jgi:phage antirepressor YoqD-like protein
MNQIIQTGGPATTMTSLEIAELTGKEHKNVIRDIRVMLDQLLKDGAILSHPHEDKDLRGYTTCFHLNRELTDTLLTGYSAAARLKVVRRWHELEGKAAAPVADPMEVLKDPVSMRTLLLGYSERVISLEAEKAAMAPKVAGYNLIATSDSDYTITQAAKMLNLVPHSQLFQYLNANQWIYKANGRGPWLPHVGRIKQGFMVLGGHAVTHSDGHVETEPQARITAKGLTRLAELFAKVPEAA